MNTVGALMDSWYDLINGISVPVYKIDVPETETGNYVIIRPESGTGQNNKRSLADDVVIITDVVTVFNNNANGETAEDIDAEVFDLVLPTPQGHGLTEPSGMQILNVKRETFNYLQEQDGTRVYHRKISRYVHRIHQTT